jgi:predicted HicB family RNase H-like nuclease
MKTFIIKLTEEQHAQIKIDAAIKKVSMQDHLIEKITKKEAK